MYNPGFTLYKCVLAYDEATTLYTLRGRHQRHCPAHKSRNLTRAVCIILTVQYQQKHSAATVESQRTVLQCMLATEQQQTI